jgi:two-component system, cell cycle response regulator
MKIQSVLIVDDDLDLLPVIKEGLESLGFSCSSASSVTSALNLLQNQRFDLVLTDISMPEMNGLDLTRQIKKTLPFASVIIMTGYARDFDYDQAMEAGASDFIKKPFTLRELGARVFQVQQQENFRRDSFRDELTGLYNRRGLFALAEHYLKLGRRNKKNFYLLFADLDDLKMINDKWGHRQGDLALQEMAKIMRKSFREPDIVARIGGDEFVVVPVEMSDKAHIESIIERLHRSLARFNSTGEYPFYLSISFGLSFCDPGDPYSIEELINRADESMYERKKSKKEGLSR